MTSHRATAYLPAGHGHPIADRIVLEHDERRLRRKALQLKSGAMVLVDFPDTITLEHLSGLRLDDGRIVEIVAAPELLYAVQARDQAHLTRLAWHIGNRHTPAQLDAERILIKRDHVLRTMLEGLGATITAITEPFFAEHGAYHAHGVAGHALLQK